MGKAVKKYLKKEGILVCNNSHGDASMASMDPDYELIATYNRRTDEKFSISSKNLKEYMIPKKKVKVTRKSIEEAMKGIPYTKYPSGYVFRKNRFILKNIFEFHDYHNMFKSKMNQKFTHHRFM